MNLVKRLRVLQQLAEWIDGNEEQWENIKKDAFQHNKWFTEDFVNHRIGIITANYLNKRSLEEWIKHYHIDDNITPRKVGIVMAGNIPLVGFHDFLGAFVAGHYSYIKLSEKDSVLFKGIVEKMREFDPDTAPYITIAESLKGCDAYIATGSNNSSRYFEYYFGKYPSVIRKNKTSVAVLTGLESEEDLKHLADDVFLYFGLGCRSVTQIYVPENYDFQPLLKAFSKYRRLKDHDKFRNNYDYFLALLMMNDRKYMSNDCIVMVEENSLFSPVSQLYYSFYSDEKQLMDGLKKSNVIQCVIGKEHVAFGDSQNTGLFDYADGVDTMQFLLTL